MIEGQVGADMIMQCIQQVQKRLYHRDQALNCRARLQPDRVGPAGDWRLQKVQEGKEAEAEFSGGRRGRAQDGREEPRARWWGSYRRDFFWK